MPGIGKKPSTFPSRSVTTMFTGLPSAFAAEAACCRIVCTSVGFEVGCGDTCRRAGADQTWCRHGVGVVRWSISDMTDAHTHSITLDSAILDPHQHVARMRQVFCKTNNE